jgi:hypothetical protein
MHSNHKRAARYGVALLSGAAVVGASLFVNVGSAFATVSPVSITKVGATAISSAGGTNVAISGKGFLNVRQSPTGGDQSAVKFGSTAAASYLVVSDSQIIAVAPTSGLTASATPIDVEVTDKGGNVSAHVTGDKVKVVDPITASVPANTVLNSLGGSVVTVTSNVAWGTSATAFSAAKITATVDGVKAPLKWLSNTTAALTVPAGTPGTGASAATPASIMLYNNGVEGTSDDTDATYAAVISKLSAVSGPVAGGGSVKVTGKGFTGATSWKFGSVAATCSGTKDTEVTCTVPNGGAAGAVSVSFTPANHAVYGTLAGATYTFSDVS